MRITIVRNAEELWVGNNWKGETMERITTHEGRYISINGCKSLYLNEERPGAPASNAIVRLAAYEDKGLLPDEITTEPYGCVFYCNRKCNLNDDFCAEGPGCPWELSAEAAKHLLELAQAEKDERLVVLPYNVGDPDCKIVHTPNAPLTLDELSKIFDNDEGPVWVTHGVVATPAILDRYDGELVAVWSAMGIEDALHEKDYGVLWLAYRRKPAEKTV